MADFTYTPSSAQRKRAPITRRMRFGDGYEQVVAFGINTNAATWELNFVDKPPGNIAAVEAFLSSKLAATSFTWAQPDGGADINVRCRTWSDSLAPGNVRALSATFEQVFV
jgi:phage-related protein